MTHFYVFRFGLTEQAVEKAGPAVWEGCLSEECADARAGNNLVFPQVVSWQMQEKSDVALASLFKACQHLFVGYLFKIAVELSYGTEIRRG